MRTNIWTGGEDQYWTRIDLASYIDTVMQNVGGREDKNGMGGGYEEGRGTSGTLTTLCVELCGIKLASVE